MGRKRVEVIRTCTICAPEVLLVRELSPGLGHPIGGGRGGVRSPVRNRATFLQFQTFSRGEPLECRIHRVGSVFLQFIPRLVVFEHFSAPRILRISSEAVHVA